MKFLGNVVWFVFGGFVIAIQYCIGSLLLMVTIVGIPFGLQTLKMAHLAIWPFGRDSTANSKSSGCLSLIMNILWLIFGGIWIAISHAVLGALLCITIIGIPFGLQHFKLVIVALSPFGRKIVKG